VTADQSFTVHWPSHSFVQLTKTCAFASATSHTYLKVAARIRYDTKEELNIDSKTDRNQLNLAHM